MREVPTALGFIEKKTYEIWRFDGVIGSISTAETSMSFYAVLHTRSGDEAKTEARVNTEDEKRLASLRAEISRLRQESERPGLTEIFGGLGYIAGLAGIWLYAKSRKRDKE